jgi:hypothetical protein
MYANLQPNQHLWQRAVGLQRSAYKCDEHDWRHVCKFVFTVNKMYFNELKNEFTNI